MRYLIYLFIVLFFTGCSGWLNWFGGGTKVSHDNAAGYEEIMRIKADCRSCADSRGENLKINGVEYTSDIAIKCCLKQSRIDTNAAIKKVYIHSVIDQRDENSGIKFIAENKTVKLQTKDRIEALFYAFLKDELRNRGILTVDSQESPYTYRVDFAFTNYEGLYSQNGQVLTAIMQGKLGVKNINKTRVLNVNTRQEARKLEAENIEDFSLYIHLLSKQMANKVAEEISKL